MELVTVGTGTVAPSARRTCPCHWVARGELRMLLDCGAGSLHRLAEFGLPWHQVTHVVLTHFHPDHWGELPMLVYALKYTTEPPRSEPFVILGPPGVVLAPGGACYGFAPDSPTGRRLGHGCGSEAISLDALLSSGRNFGPGQTCGHPLSRAGVGRERWRSLHHWRRETIGRADRDAAWRHARRSRQGHLRHRGDGLPGAAHARDSADGGRPHRQRWARRCVAAGGSPGRARDHSRLAAVQAGQP